MALVDLWSLIQPTSHDRGVKVSGKPARDPVGFACETSLARKVLWTFVLQRMSLTLAPVSYRYQQPGYIRNNPYKPCLFPQNGDLVLQFGYFSLSNVKKCACKQGNLLSRSGGLYFLVNDTEVLWWIDCCCMLEIWRLCFNILLCIVKTFWVTCNFEVVINEQKQWESSLSHSLNGTNHVQVWFSRSL